MLSVGGAPVCRNNTEVDRAATWECAGITMKVLEGLDKLNPPLTRTVLTIGNFDGVHRAHQQLLAQAGLFAVGTGGPVVVLTFEPHPLTIVAPEKAPARLSTQDQKMRYLAQAGADIVVVARSEPKLLALEATEFISDVIIKLFHPTHIVEGPSFGFGRGRKGSPEMLRDFMAGRSDSEGGHCEVHIVHPVTVALEDGDESMVSSSLIRKLIAEGKPRRAALCLGRPYMLSGQVVEGDRRGRTLGFPTANLEPVEQLVPKDGVYAGYAVVDGVQHAAAISIGANATFGGVGQRIEAHLLDFDEDIYGATIDLAFQRRLRDHQRFETPELLCEQLRRDVTSVRESWNPTDATATPYGDRV